MLLLWFVTKRLQSDSPGSEPMNTIEWDGGSIRSTDRGFIKAMEEDTAVFLSDFQGMLQIEISEGSLPVYWLSSAGKWRFFKGTYSMSQSENRYSCTYEKGTVALLPLTDSSYILEGPNEFEIVEEGGQILINWKP